MKIAFLPLFAVLALLTFAQAGWVDNGTNVTTTRNVGVKTSNPNADFAVNGRYSVLGGTTHLSNFVVPDSGLEVQSTNNAFLGVYGKVNAGGYSNFFFTCAPQWDYAGFTSTQNGNGKLLPILFSVTNGVGSPEKMRIATNGNVGIGTSNPQSKLAVDGTITAKEVVVTTSDWPDYVFEDSYELMPLDQLAQSIATHGKLPGVPSAAELEQGGVSLGEMQKSLMEKVEELTLYMLQLKRENDALKSEVGNLKTQISSN